MNNDTVDKLSLVLQMINLELLFKDYCNSDIMQEIYNIKEQNKKIIELLERTNKNGKSINRENR